MIVQYYLRTGTCKFGASCKFHHPRHAGGSLSNVPLNTYGYPLRPVTISTSLFIIQLVVCYCAPSLTILGLFSCRKRGCFLKKIKFMDNSENRKSNQDIIEKNSMKTGIRFSILHIHF